MVVALVMAQISSEGSRGGAGSSSSGSDLNMLAKSLWLGLASCSSSRGPRRAPALGPAGSGFVPPPLMAAARSASGHARRRRGRDYRS